jgi:hypothetical protein
MTETEQRRAIKRKYFTARRQAGKCNDCSKPAVLGTSRCEPCTVRNRERTRGYDRRRLVFAWRPIDHALGTDE